MTAVGLELIALVAVVLSFAFAALVVTAKGSSTETRTHDDDDRTDDDATIARVVADIERLQALRERGALTDREFAAQKSRLLQNQK